MHLAGLRVSILGVALAALAAAGPAHALDDPAAVVVKPPVGGLASDNVEYVGTMPVENPGVGAELLRMPSGEQRLFVTGQKGISIFDVTSPASPRLLGRFPFVHSQNEDVEVSPDGARLFIAVDGSSIVPSDVNPGTHLFDVSDPANIRKLATHPDTNHTVECADAACDWIYGTRNRGIYRVTFDGASSSIVRTGALPFSGAVHAFHRDGSGYVITDSTPTRRVLDVSDPGSPVVVASGTADGVRDTGAIQHNNLRPNADRWEPRDPSSPGYSDPDLRPGELLIGGSERNREQSCAVAGGMSTWSMANFDKGEPLTQLHVVKPVRGNWVAGDGTADGNPPGNVNGCSSHWFSYRNGMVAAGWFEHGIRFFEIDERTGAISQRGFFNPVWTSASAAHWVVDANGDEYVYTVDYARGIDILRFHRDAAAPSPVEIDGSWLSGARGTNRLAQRERYLCHLAGGGSGD